MDHTGEKLSKLEAEMFRLRIHIGKNITLDGIWVVNVWGGVRLAHVVVKEEAYMN